MFNELEGCNFEEADGDWNKIWKVSVPEKCKTFIWLLKHSRLLRNLARTIKASEVRDASFVELSVKPVCMRCRTVQNPCRFGKVSFQVILVWSFLSEFDQVDKY